MLNSLSTQCGLTPGICRSPSTCRLASARWHLSPGTIILFGSPTQNQTQTQPPTQTLNQTHTHPCTRMHTCARMCIHTCAQLCSIVQKMCTRVHVCAHVCTCVHMCAHVCTCVHARVHTTFENPLSKQEIETPKPPGHATKVIKKISE